MATGRRKRFRNRGKRKEKLRSETASLAKEKDVVWKKLTGTTSASAPTNWKQYEIKWADMLDIDFLNTSFYQEQFLGNWKVDERDSSTSKREADSKRDSQTAGSNRTRATKGLGPIKGRRR